MRYTVVDGCVVVRGGRVGKERARATPSTHDILSELPSSLYQFQLVLADRLVCRPAAATTTSFRELISWAKSRLTRSLCKQSRGREGGRDR